MPVTHVTLATFDKEVVQSKLPVLVDFWASWCGPCKMMAPVLEQLSEDYAGKVKFAKIDTEQEFVLSERHNITGIPCLILFKKGKETSRSIGFMPKEKLKEKIDASLKST